LNIIQSAIQFLEAHYLILATIKIVIVFAALSGLVAYLVLMERKVLAFMQARLGPMRVGPWGLLQPIADGIKLLLKEDIVPAGADKYIFLLAPVISIIAAFTAFAVVPFGPQNKGFVISDINIGLLFILAVSSLGIYGIILGGWSSNSHYPLLGALRSSAQLVSYEVAAGLAIIGVLLCSNSLSMVQIVQSQAHAGIWNVFRQPVAFVIYLIAAVAETNRNPFDLPEAESELTAGFHTEYSGFRFALYFMAEYTAMVLVSAIAVTLFWGGWLRPFASVHWLDFLNYTPVFVFLVAGVAVILGSVKNPVPGEKLFLMAVAGLCFFLAVVVAIPVVNGWIQGVFWFVAKVMVFLYAFIWYRGTFPRYRYDQLMNVGWRVMIPVALANIIVTAAVIYWVSKPQAVGAAMLLFR
jgi:NADH-quinone oxidoreductase subunit H